MSLVLAPGALEAIVQLRTALSSLRIVLIGASALKTHLPLERPAGDIDLLFLMDTEDPLPLLAPLGWRRDPRMKHRYIAATSRLGDVENQRGTRFWGSGSNREKNNAKKNKEQQLRIVAAAGSARPVGPPRGLAERSQDGSRTLPF